MTKHPLGMHPLRSGLHVQPLVATYRGSSCTAYTICTPPSERGPRLKVGAGGTSGAGGSFPFFPFLGCF